MMERNRGIPHEGPLGRAPVPADRLEGLARLLEVVRHEGRLLV